MSSELSQPMTSPVARASPLFTASAWPPSFSETHSSAPLKRFRISTLSSRLPPSMTRYSIGPQPSCESTLRMVRSRKRPWLYDGVTTETLSGIHYQLYVPDRRRHQHAPEGSAVLPARLKCRRAKQL